MIWSAYSDDQGNRSDEEQQRDKKQAFHKASAKEQVTPFRLAAGSIYSSLP